MSVELSEAERKLAIEHRDMLMDLRAILTTDPGKRFFKYLFKSFDVAQAVEQGLEGNFLHDRLGFLRAGNSIFKITAEANSEVAANILAQIEKERYAEIYSDAQIGQS